MKRTLNPQMMEFQSEVQAFVRANKPADGDVWADARWCRALAEKGWQAPGWPEELGGTGWDATRRYLWLKTLCEEIPGYRGHVGIEQVAPLLMTWASRQQQDRWLPAILSFDKHWILGCFDADTSLGDAQATARDVAGGWQISGHKSWLMPVQRQTNMLATARISQSSGEVGLFALDVTAAAEAGALVTQDIEHLDGTSSLRMDFTCAPCELVHRFASAGTARAALAPLLVRGLGESGIARAQLSVLQASADAAQASTEVHAVEIELSALEIMEQRYVDAMVRGIEPPFPALALQVRTNQLLTKIGALLVDSFGYYALPFPDLALSHNEPLPGGLPVRRAMRDWLTQTAYVNYLGLAGNEYDKLSLVLSIDQEESLRGK